MWINDFRLTVISARMSFDKLTAAYDPSDKSLPLTNRFHYEEAFRANRGTGGVVHADLGLPWHNGRRNTFWWRYLDGLAPAEIDAGTSWRFVIPFRLKFRPAEILTRDVANESVSYECYGFPHGIVLAVTLRYCGPVLTVTEWVERSHAFRSGAALAIEHHGGRDNGFTLDAVIGWLKTAFIRRYFGTLGEPLDSVEAATLMTVVQGKGAEKQNPIDEDIQRALHAVTAWPSPWTLVKPPALALGDNLLPMLGKNLTPACCLYAQPRGRTLWMPPHFDASRKGGGSQKPHTLSCYHRNLVSGTVQAESLVGFAHCFAPTAGGVRKNIVSDRQLPRQVAQRLKALYTGEGSYRSASIRAMIGEMNNRICVNELLNKAKISVINFDEPPKISLVDQSHSPLTS